MGANKAKLRVLFHRFLRVVCTPTSPLVLSLDDLQWADTASMELVQSLVRETVIPGLLLIGIYRSNEVNVEDSDSSHPLTNFLNAAKDDDKHVQVTTFEVGNLGLTDVRSLLSHALNEQYPSEAHIDRLAFILQQKTDGNAYFVIQLLKQLYRKEIIKYNVGIMKWKWDNEEIESSVEVSDNVAEFMEANLQSCLSPVATLIIQAAACLGNEFDEKILFLLMRGLQHAREGYIAERLREMYVDITVVEIDEAIRIGLEECVEFGFLRRKRSEFPSYVFAHDRVLEAPTRLVGDQHKIDGLHHSVGTALIEQLPPTLLEEHLFVAADSINRGSTRRGTEKCFDVNFRAGKKAMAGSAFDAAVVYFNVASELLSQIESEKSVSWATDDELRPCGIDLFTTFARAHYCAGNMEECMHKLTQILSPDTIPIEDKLVAFTIQSEALSIQEKHTEEFNTSLEILRTLGVKFPPPNAFVQIGIITRLLKTKAALKRLSTENLINLPDMTDQRRIRTLKLIDRALVRSVVRG